MARYVFDGSLLLIATCSASSFYIACQRELFRTWAESVKYLPFLMSLGVGVAMNNARAAFEGFFGKASEFVRTPKFGVINHRDPSWRQGSAKQGLDPKRIQAYCELAMALYLIMCVAYTAYLRIWFGLFFMTLFMIGYVYVAMLTLYGQYMTSRMEALSREGRAGSPATTPDPARTSPSIAEPIES